MKVFPYILVAVVCAIVVPCLVTFCVNGKQGDGTASLERISTGRDVLVQTKAGNELVDVEKYVAHIMPGIVDASADDSYLQAQAVALRTKVYYAMGDATVIQASDLEFQYYTEEDYIAKWGRENYKSVKARYERAVIATKGKIIEQKEDN
ncbi:hypothetical protein DXC24_09520 [Clostridium sp. OM08-29]|nr:hypothetical protein DXC24_09520 [Clostridium sp. OM08-29]